MVRDLWCCLQCFKNAGKETDELPIIQSAAYSVPASNITPFLGWKASLGVLAE